MTTRTLSRVPFQGTEDVVWGGPRGSTPGFHRLPLRGTSTVRAGLHTEFPVPSRQFPETPTEGRVPPRGASWTPPGEGNHYGFWDLETGNSPAHAS